MPPEAVVLQSSGRMLGKLNCVKMRISWIGLRQRSLLRPWCHLPCLAVGTTELFCHLPQYLTCGWWACQNAFDLSFILEFGDVLLWKHIFENTDVEWFSQNLNIFLQTRFESKIPLPVRWGREEEEGGRNMDNWWEIYFQNNKWMKICRRRTDNI